MTALACVALKYPLAAAAVVIAGVVAIVASASWLSRRSGEVDIIRSRGEDDLHGRAMVSGRCCSASPARWPDRRRAFFTSRLS